MLTNTNVYENLAATVCSLVEPELSSSAPDLAYLAARRVVASLSMAAEWPTLKAATSMTIPLFMCARPIWNAVYGMLCALAFSRRADPLYLMCAFLKHRAALAVLKFDPS